MDSFGSYLKSQREKKGIRLEEIASITKIHVHSLELMEAGKWDDLPPEPFIRGFIVAYSKYVGLSQTEVMERFREATGAPALPVQETATEKQPEPLPAGKVAAPPQELTTPFRLPSAPRVLTAAALVAVVAIALVLINVGKDDAAPAPVVSTAVAPQTQAPLVLAESGKDPAPATKEAEAVAATPLVMAPAPEKKEVGLASEGPTPAAAAPITHQVTVQGKDRTWMKVVIDDQPPTELFLGEGESTKYEAQKKIKIVLGNSAGAIVTHNGKTDEGKQLMGTIRTYKFPENARFPQDPPKQPASIPAQ